MTKSEIKEASEREKELVNNKTEKPVWSSIEKKDAVKYLGDFGL